jgi:hypothetical protein
MKIGIDLLMTLTAGPANVQKNASDEKAPG